MDKQDKHAAQDFKTLMIPAGMLCLLGSSATLYASTSDFFDSSSEVREISVVCMLIARLFGIGAFCIGVYCIFFQRWTVGVLLILGSLVLPFVSLFFHGTF